MPLDKSCERYKEELVFVLPTEGYGWSKRLPTTSRFQPGEHTETPQPFHARIFEFHYFLGHIRAGIGIVEQQDHPLDKEWLAFCVRDGMGTLTYDLSNSPAQHNLSLGVVKPTINIDPANLAMPEWIEFKRSPHLSGLGYVVDKVMSLDDIFKRTQK
jgi:hypothetical protein